MFEMQLPFSAKQGNDCGFRVCFIVHVPQSLQEIVSDVLMASFISNQTLEPLSDMGIKVSVIPPPTMLEEMLCAYDVTLYSTQLSKWFADKFEMSNGGKPKLNFTPKMIELLVGVRT